MLVIRCPSPYDRIGRPAVWRSPLLIALGSVAVLAAGLLAGHAGGVIGEFLWLMLIVLSVIVTGVVAATSLAGNGSQGSAGERAALASLAPLPGDVTAVVNFLVPGFEVRGDLDLILVGSFGAVVIEVKNLLGGWIVNGDSWIREGGVGGPGVRRSVSKQLKGQVDALKRFLTAQGAGVPVTGIIGVNGNAAIRIEAPGPYSIVPYDRLAAFVSTLPAVSGARIDVARGALVSHAESASRSGPTPRRPSVK